MINHAMISEIYYHAVEESRDVTKRSANTITRLKSHEVVKELEKGLKVEEKILRFGLPLGEWGFLKEG